MEIIGVIIAGVIIGLLGKFVAPRPRQHPALADHHLWHRWGLDRVVHLHRFWRRRQPGIDWVRWLIAIAVAAVLVMIAAALTAGSPRRVPISRAPCDVGHGIDPQMPPAAAPRDLTYTTALVAACQRIWAARRRRTVAYGRRRSRGADRRRRGSRRHLHRGLREILAARRSQAAPDDSATAAVMVMPFRRGLLRRPLSIDDPAEGASWDGVGRRALLVAQIEGSPRQPVRLVWYATGPASWRRIST